MNKPLLIALGVYLIAISLISAAAVIIDKLRSKRRGARRIPEAVLIRLAFFGGAIVMLITMLVVRHKTLHPKFMVGLPAIILLHSLIFAAAVFLGDLTLWELFIL